MKRVIVILKKADASRTATKSLSLGTTESIQLQKLIDFEPQYASFLSETKRTVSPETRLAFDESLGAAGRELDRTYTYQIADDAKLPDLLKRLAALADVQDAREDLLNVMSLVPNDPMYANLWGMQKIQAPLAWDLGQGNGVVVAVCDTGVDANHPDLAGNIWRNALGHFGKDFSGNVSGNVNPDNDPSDYHGHGTHVAGTIAAIGNNNTGVIGVAPRVKVMSVKIFPNAYNSVCANAIYFAANNGARVINCSWGPSSTGPVPVDPTLKNAIDYALVKGCYCVFAAGNANLDCSIQFPANYDKVICVAATDQNDQRASFSDFGAVVDIAAPGKDILSTKMGGGYHTLSGTSMAAPHVTGAVALLLEKAPRLSLANIRYFLHKSGDPIATDKNISGKRLQLYRLLFPAMQTYKRQTIVRTSGDRYAMHSSGSIARIGWNGTTWVQSLIGVWGPPVCVGSLIEMEPGLGRVAGVNSHGVMVNTYFSGSNAVFAPIHETFGLVPGTLRYSPARKAFWAVNVFNDIAYMCWFNNQWNMDIVPGDGQALAHNSVEICDPNDDLMAISTTGVVYGVYGPSWGQLLADGSRAWYGPIPTTGGLMA